MHTAVFETDNQKDLLHSTGDSARCYEAAWLGGGLGEDGYMYTYGRVPLLST